ncbi:MAG: ABC transporter permease [Desulfobacterales bacterium]|nr:ABC transporter permease [Desulfobacterales bacterium]
MIGLRIEKRQETPFWRSCLVLAGAVGISLALSAAMLAFQDRPALSGIGLLFQGAFGTPWAMEDCLVKAIPIFLCSLGVAIAFRLQIWNIGAEGQFAFGAVGATWVALNLPGQPAWVTLGAMMAASMAFGGLWGLIPAVLKVRARANEIIVTLMMNYLAILFIDYLVYGAWKDPTSFGFPVTPEFSAGAIIGMIPGTRVNWGLVLCLVFGVVMWVFLRFTRLGFELKASGENIRAARYARLPYDRLVALVMVASGALAGCAGFVEASANLNRLQPSIMVGYGYTAIVVAWLARLNPLLIAVASFLLAGLRVGVETLQLDLQVPAAFGGIMEGLILLTVLAGGFFEQYRIRFRKSP